MRHKLVLLALMAFCNCNMDAFSQNIPLIPLGNALWDYEIWDPGGSGWFHQYIIGDTVINETEYTKFRIDAYDSNFNPFPDTILLNRQDFLIRIENGKIFKRENNLHDTLLFDSHWNIGDTIEVPFFETAYLLENIDTVEIGDVKRRRWTFFDFSIGSDQKVSFVEGIGSTSFDLREPIFRLFWEAGASIKCCIVNNEKLISGGCYFSTDISAKKESSNTFRIFPNPTNDKIFIKSDIVQKEELNLSIINPSGQCIYHQILTNLNTPVNLPNGLSGIYVLRLYNKEIDWEEVFIVQ